MCGIALPLVTNRLKLRSYVSDDVAEIHAVLYTDADAMHLIGGKIDIKETRQRIERYIRQQDSTGYSFWAVVEYQTGAIAGSCGLMPFCGQGPDVELGCALGSAYWGRGLATEAGRAALDEAFGPLGLERVVATIHPRNLRSQRLAAKLGFVPASRRHVRGIEHLY